MALTAVALKAASIAVEAEKKHPGLWKKIIAGVLVIIVAAVFLLVQAIVGIVDPFFRGGYIPVCSVEVVDGGGSDDPHDKAPGGGEFSTSGTAWPTSDSANVVYPVPNPVLTSPWGYRPPMLVNGQLTPGYHNGLDFGQPLGSPVLAMADGVVAGAYGGNSLYGSHVAIKHRIGGENYTSVYGHIIGTSITVKVGDTVKAGQQVAQIGSEGMSTAAHLHFVLTKGDYSAQSSEPGYTGAEGNTIDPAAFLRTQGAGKASGGLGNDNFDGVTSEGDLACDSDEGAEFEGDGFTSWGGYTRGEIPADLLRTINFTGDKRLFSRAAVDLEAMNAEFKAAFGKNLRVLRAYETSGSTQFGWARAVQLELSFGSPEHNWMKDNSSRFGWNQPATFQQGGTAANAGLWGWKGSGTSVPPAATPDAQKARSYAEGLVKGQYGWSDADYRCLVKLWERESNWNPLADNPTSDAYGIPQALPGSKMASEGADWKTNPETQIKWGLRYIKERYVTPCEAWNHSERVNWY